MHEDKWNQQHLKPQQLIHNLQRGVYLIQLEIVRTKTNYTLFQQSVSKIQKRLILLIEQKQQKEKQLHLVLQTQAEKSIKEEKLILLKKQILTQEKQINELNQQIQKQYPYIDIEKQLINFRRKIKNQIRISDLKNDKKYQSHLFAKNKFNIEARPNGKIGQFENKEEIQLLQPYLNQHSKYDSNFNCIASRCFKNNSIFIDNNNPSWKQDLELIDLAKDLKQYYLFSKLEQNLSPNQMNTIIECLSAADINQGEVKSYKELSAMAILISQHPQLIYRLFVLFKNPKHIYGVQLFFNGVWSTISVDVRFLINQLADYCGVRPYGSNIWPMLIEKVFAKRYGSYYGFDEIYGDDSITTLSGAPILFLQIKKQQHI